MRIDVAEIFIDGVETFEIVAKIQNQILSATDSNIEIFLSDGKLFYNRVGVFLLACLTALGTQYDKKIEFHFNVSSSLWDKSNPPSYFQLETKENVIQLVSENISGKIPIQMSENFKEILVSLIGEVYNNAVEHSERKYTIGSCHNEYNDISRLCFSCYDTGIGIIENVRRYFGKEFDGKFHDYDISRKLLRWALQKGHSTKAGSRGLGIDMLLEFARLNSGYVRICNENVLFEQNAYGEIKYQKLDDKFQGLFFEMHIVEDPKAIYKLKGE